jgi:succinate-semialdehyde dehydrogenase/glutarate-semialdehyde dehydrogenase
LQTLLLPPADLEQIIGHKLVAGVTLTGSTQAGRSVAQLAGKHLKKCVLELGGSDAYVILNDVNINEAAHICVQGRLKNSGQSCVAAKRFIVTPKNKEAFEQAMTLLMQQQSYGDPLQPMNIVGPMARKDLRDELHQQVQRSIEMGATLLCGGYIPPMEGYYYPPTVLTNVTKGMPAFDEELFGPVAAIIAAEDEADAIAIANDSEYGLGAAVLGNDAALTKNIATNMLEAGNCFVNAFVHSDARLPFGGIKNSGYGRELGDYGIKEFVNIKTVFIK